MTNNKWLLVSVLSTVVGVGIAAAQPGGPGGAKHFEKLDTNGDGVVTSTEFEAGFMDRFTKSDANQDGKVTADEFKAQHEARMKEHPKHDGQGSKHEGKGPHEMRGLPGDSNNDGVVTKAEAQADVQKLAKKIDSNGDGKLTQDELAAGHGHGGHCSGKGKEEAAPATK